MRNKAFMTIAAVMACTLFLGIAGCAGGGAKVQSEIHTTTTGQQLMDLKKALDSGAISQEEYDKEREKILKK